MTAFPPGVSGNPAGKPKGPHKLTEAIREVVEKDGAKIVADIVKNAVDGDVEARRLVVRYLLPRYRFTPSPVDLKPAVSADEVREQIGKFISMTASGLMDLDTMRVLVDGLRTILDGRVQELEAMIRDLAVQARTEGDP